MSDEKQDFRFGAFMIVRNHNVSSILLVKHAYGEKKWSLPGGRMEQGELITKAAERETKEETGQVVKAIKLIGIFSNRKSLGIAALFLGKLEGENQIDFPSEEISECRFIEVNKLNDFDIYPAQRGLINHYLNWDENGQSWTYFDYMIPPPLVGG